MGTVGDRADDSTVAWIEASFERLAGSADDLYKKVWTDGRIGYAGESAPPDEIDEYGARLICAALARNESLFISLPDHLPRRPALLFATALIRYWFNRLQVDPQQISPMRPILYLGSTVGIREQLAQVKIQNRSWNLGDVFQPSHLTRDQAPSGRMRSSGDGSSLPSVYTAYVPALPDALLQRVRPAWLVVDCADATRANWLAGALASAKRAGIPVIGWGQNPLSECVRDFRTCSLIWAWPQHCGSSPVAAARERGSGMGSLLHVLALGTSTIQPVVLSGDMVDPISEGLGAASRAISQASYAANGQLARDAVLLHRRFLRALELLSIPVDLHDAESHHYWGVSAFARLQRDCERFRNACRTTYPALVQQLESASVLLESALTQLRSSEPPLWHALTNTCVNDPPSGEARLIVFQSGAAKQLFLLSLLARFDVSHDDLAAMRTRVLSLDEFGRAWRLRQSNPDQTAELLEIDPALKWHPIVIGMPSTRVSPKLSGILLQELTDIVVYPHQERMLGARLAQLTSQLDGSIQEMTSVMGRLRNCDPPVVSQSVLSGFHIGAPLLMDLGAHRREARTSDVRLWADHDPADELSALFSDDAEIDGEGDVAEDAGAARGTDERDSVEEWCSTALEFEFVGGWHALFALDEQLNLVSVSSGPRVEARYARSVRQGDRVVLIHGQRRQNLYDLIISRIHRNPSIELHLALVRRWQDDLIASFEQWRRRGGTVDTLLGRMQELGSGLISSLTLRNWLARKIIAPDDCEDLRRLAIALDLKFVSEHHRRIDKAASRLRGLHRGLANRLNRWLEQQAAGSVDASDDEVFDSELGLRFSDFRDSLLFLVVSSANEVQGPFLRSQLGRLERLPA